MSFIMKYLCLHIILQVCSEFNPMLRKEFAKTRFFNSLVEESVVNLTAYEGPPDKIGNWTISPDCQFGIPGITRSTTIIGEQCMAHCTCQFWQLVGQAMTDLVLEGALGPSCHLFYLHSSLSQFTFSTSVLLRGTVTQQHCLLAAPSHSKPWKSSVGVTVLCTVNSPCCSS